MRVAVLSLLFGVGCAGGEPAADAGAPQAQAFPVEVGSGRTTFQPLADGDSLYLERGFQGAQHVLVSVRALGLAAGRYFTDLELVRDDGVVLSEPARARVPYAAMPDGTGAELFGYRLVVANESVDAALAGEARVSVTVEDGEGLSAGDERAVVVEWAFEGWDPDAG